MVTLIGSGITDSSLVYHLETAKNHGVTQEEAAAIITHVAFYAGWPKARAAFNLAKEVWGRERQLAELARFRYTRRKRFYGVARAGGCQCLRSAELIGS